jgi:membrane-associated PAP2 superfamily phosphatase
LKYFGSDWGNFSKVNYGGTYPFLVWSATVHWPLRSHGRCFPRLLMGHKIK